MFTAVKTESDAHQLPCPTTPKKGTRPGMTTPKKASKGNKTPQKAPLSESLPECNQLPVEGEVEAADSSVDATKKILYSRGSAILKAGYERQNQIKSPSKASEVLNLLSPQKRFASHTLEIIGSPSKSPYKSPSKLSDVLNTLSPRRLNMDTAAHKLKSPQTVSVTSTVPTAKGSAASILSNIVAPAEKQVAPSRPMPSGRDRLRNKFKHLISNEGGKSQPKPITEVVAISSVSKDRKVGVPEGEKVVENTSKSSTEVVEQSNTVEGVAKERASQRFKHLAQKTTTKAKSSFVLPGHFREVLEMFRCVDSILFLLYQRSEICTFEKLKRAVQEMSSKSFTEDHLAAMKTVLPTAFVFRQEKGLISLKEQTKSGAHQLTIEPNFKEQLTSNSSKVSIVN